jgi:hypothetical protein
MNLLNISDDWLIEIFSYLSGKDLSYVKSTCSKLYVLINSDKGSVLYKKLYFKFLKMSNETDFLPNVLSYEEKFFKSIQLLHFKLWIENFTYTTDEKIVKFSTLQQIYKTNILFILWKRYNTDTIIPFSIGALINLNELYIHHTNIKKISPSIGSLKNLTILSLSSNNINENIIPPEIGLLTNLKELYLSNNCIYKIPKEIGKLKNLKSLSLMNNMISYLPDEIYNLNLSELKLSNNPITKK